MTSTTFDDARRCPRCEQPGLPVGTTSQRDGSKIHRFQCQNNRCRWFDSAPWIVQVRRDGTIAQPDKHDKFFPTIPDLTAEVQEAIDRDIARQMGNGRQ